MERFSVKKPFTILVAVIMVLALGIVSMTRMTTDLLPSISFPYLMVITPYPGASPEKVELEVTAPLEQALGTVKNVRQVTSVSAENYSIVQLEFADGSNMDSAMVNVSSTINQLAAALPAASASPSILEISMDMIATMYVAVSRDGDDVYALSDYVEKEVIPTLQRQDGVARVTSVGLVEQTVQVELSQEKIDRLNDRILEKTNAALASSRAALDQAQAQVDAGQRELKRQESQFGSTLSSALFGQINAPAQQLAQALRAGALDLAARLKTLEAAMELPIMMGELLPDADDPLLRGDLSQRARALAARLEELAAGLLDGSTVSDLMEAREKINAVLRESEALMDEISLRDGAQRFSNQIAHARAAIEGLAEKTDAVPGVIDTLQTAFAALAQGQLDAAVGFSTAAQQLSAAQAQLQNAYAQYDSQRAQALASANLDALVDAGTLSKLIYAQNFAMPAGYINDAQGRAWLLRVGEEYDSSGDVSETLLCDIDGIGAVRVSDIATITVIDNAAMSYANLNGSTGVVLSVYKGSTSGTNAVSRSCAGAIQKLQDEDPQLHLTALVDQGKYITLIVSSIVKSMALGALLAILVLALFLRDVRPTGIVGVSIPLSVLFSLLLMYFTDLSLNMMTLSGLALGIGMLVDNSIVVMENIIRMRSRGIAAPRAAVQGARQVRGAIVASTLTTVCVFLPMVFTTGTVREMLLPLALSVSYCLVASLIVALTVIPASASTLLRRVQPRPNAVMERVQQRYARALRWCLAHRALPLVLSVALLAFSVAEVLRVGIVILPEMTADSIQVSITTPESDERMESYARVDRVMERMLTVDGINDIGIMDFGSMASTLGAFAGVSDGAYGRYQCYVTVPDDAGQKETLRICADIERVTADCGCEITVSSGSMTDLTAFVSQGLAVNIYGPDLDRLAAIAAEVAAEAGKLTGFEEISTGMEDAADTLHLVIDRDRATSCGLTVAQIYAEILDRLTTDVISTSITVDGMEMNVVVSDKTDPLTRENLLDMEFSGAGIGAMGGVSAMDGMSGMGAMSGMDAMSGMSAMSGMDAMSGMSAMSGMDAMSGMSGMGAGDAGDASAWMGTQAAPVDGSGQTHRLREFASVEQTLSAASINREDLNRYVTVSARTAEGYNTTLLTRELRGALDRIAAQLPNGYSLALTGEADQVSDMVHQMLILSALGLLFIYLVMVAQFQSLLSPFIILFTVPLAFTGGMFGLLAAGEQLSMLSAMGFLILMGTVVNNGIVFVDYANQLRIGGLEKRDALVATGQTRMRPILMTALTTILAMGQLIFGRDMGSQMGRGMAIVIAGGLLYATLMTLFIIPILYDILYRRCPVSVDVGDDVDELPDDAAEHLSRLQQSEKRETE